MTLLSEELDKRITAILHTPPPYTIPEYIITDLHLPSHKEFSDFYTAHSLYKTPITSALQDNIITISNKQSSLHMGINGIIELLASKFNQPISELHNHGSIHSPLVDFENIHKQLQSMIQEIHTCFSNILSNSDPRIIQMCKDYHYAQSIPLTLRLRFYEFEQSIISVKINNAIQEGLRESNERVRQFEQDYTERLEKAKVGFKAQVDESKKLAEKYRWIAKSLQDDLDVAQTKVSAIKDESSITSQKLIDAEARIEELDRLYSDIKIKHDKIEKELKRFTEHPWVMGSTSTIDKPTFVNVDTGEVIIYPPIEEFKTDWEMTGRKDNCFIYKKGTVTKEIPEALEFKFNDLIKELLEEPDTAVPKTKSKPIEKKLAKNDERVLDIISKSPEGLLHSEIAELAGISSKHVSKHINKLMDFGLIYSREVEDEGRKSVKYFTKNK